MTNPRPIALPRRSRTVPGRILAGVVVLLTLAGCAAPAASVPPPVTGPPAGGADAAELTKTDVDAWLDGLLTSGIDRAGIAGAAVSVVKDGEILTARGYGTTDVAAEAAGRSSRVDPERTLFRVGSVSKVGTATAVMQLVERGDIDLDADVSEYLDFDIPRSFDTPITMRTLLSHTAGFEEQARGIMLPPDTEVDLRAHLSTDPPVQVFEPGTTPAYSNYGNALAGYIVQVVSGVPFEQYIQENVLRRAGMASSSYQQPLPDELAGRLSNGYATASEPPKPFEVVTVSPAGSLSATAADMGRFMLAQLGDLPAEQAPLDQDTLDLMHAPALDGDALGVFADGPRMTLGLFDESRNGHRILGHGGDTQVFHSHMQVYPDDGVGIFIALNSSGEGLSSLTIRQAFTDGFAARYFPRGEGSDGAGSAGESVADVDGAVQSTAVEHAALAAGTYASARGAYSTFYSAFGLTGQTQVTPQPDGTVLITPGPHTAAPMVFEEIRPWVWRERGGERLLTMRETDGVVDAIGYDSAFTLLRVDTQHSGSFAFLVLGLSALVLLLGLLAWPVSAIVRRRFTAPASVGRRGRTARILARIGVISALVALIGWVGVVAVVSTFAVIPDASLRIIQALQVIGVLGIVPATITGVDAARFRYGWRRVVGAALTVLALGGIAWFAIAFRLISPDVSY